MYGNIDQTLVNSFHGLLNFEIGGLDCRVIITEKLCRVVEYICNIYYVIH